jgi:hypothetical protein
MSLLSTLKKIAVGLLFVGVAFVAGDAIAQQSPEMNAVKAANEGFYKALSARDIVAMQKVWANDGEIINLGLRHKAPDVGWDAAKKVLYGDVRRCTAAERLDGPTSDSN